MILVYITCKDEEQAKSIGKVLLEKRIIACANIFPIKSMYFWKNELQGDSEIVLICKTRTELYDEVELAVKDLHSYVIPCIMKIEVDANKEYSDWVDQEVQN